MDAERLTTKSQCEDHMYARPTALKFPLHAGHHRLQMYSAWV